MTKHLLAGVAAVVLMSGVASAQTFPSYPPAPPVAPPAAAPFTPPAPVPGLSTTTTTTVALTPGGDYRTTTTKKGVDANGNEITKKDTYREGVEGSTETHTKTETDPAGAVRQLAQRPPQRRGRGGFGPFGKPAPGYRVRVRVPPSAPVKSSFIEPALRI